MPPKDQHGAASPGRSIVEDGTGHGFVSKDTSAIEAAPSEAGSLPDPFAPHVHSAPYAAHDPGSSHGIAEEAGLTPDRGNRLEDAVDDEDQTEGQYDEEYHSTAELDPFRPGHDRDATITTGLGGPGGHGKSQAAPNEGQPPSSVMFSDRMQGTHLASQYGYSDDASGEAIPMAFSTMPEERESPGSSGETTRSPQHRSNQPLLRSTASVSSPSGKNSEVPWWLRQSRRDSDEPISASSIKAAIRLEDSQASPIPGSPRITDRRVAKGRDSQAPPPELLINPENASGQGLLPSHHSHHAQSTWGSPGIEDHAKRIRAQVAGFFGSTGVSADGTRGAIYLRQAGHMLSPRERALWKWVNVEDLDLFLQDAYYYYCRKGMWAIALSSFLDLLTIGFVIAFSTFLLGCVDYSILRSSHSLSEVIVPRCVSRSHGSTLLLSLFFAVFYCFKIIDFGKKFRQLRDMREFFTELLEIPEPDIQTISWPLIVDRLSTLRELHPASSSAVANFTDEQADPAAKSSAQPAAAKLDAHDVANRVMRRDNYFIALFNKSVLDLAIPVPELLASSRSFAFVTEKLGIVTTTLGEADLRRRGVGRQREDRDLPRLTRVLEWNVEKVLAGTVFDASGQVNREWLQEKNKVKLVDALKTRFIWMGFLNALFAPFILLYLVAYTFFRYFEEYHKNPSSIGSRTYTPLARWKFREFNELPHLYAARLSRSYPLAHSYISSFPSSLISSVARFLAFISGSFCSVLVLLSILDPDAFLHFEITKDRTVLFYIGVFGGLMAVLRGMTVTSERSDERVDVKQLLEDLIEETHYLPEEWRGKLHSAEVHNAFSALFPLKATLFLHELLSVITTPFILIFTLPLCAGAIVDFVRDFTIHVDGLGYVCSFAVFDLGRHGDARYGAPVQIPVETGTNDSYGEVDESTRRRYASNQGKLEKSVLGFKAANPTWVPQDPATSLYIERMTDIATGASALLPLSPRQPHQSHLRQHPALVSGASHPRRRGLAQSGTPRNGRARSKGRYAEDSVSHDDRLIEQEEEDAASDVRTDSGATTFSTWK